MFPENKGGRIGTYFHLFPTYAQGKKIIWDAYDRDGFKVTDHFPKELVASRNESELQITLVNGSIYQIIGTDKIDSVVGTNPAGCVFSEYALQNPKAWDLIRPILLENDGWAVFNYTPRGHNHGKRMYEMARNNPAWYSSLLTVNDTYRDDQSRLITDAMIDEERFGPQPMSEELIQQEYYCSFEGYQEGSIYVKQLRQARKDGRICAVPWQSALPVFTFWDLGYGDATAIWFCQRVGEYYNFIDYYEQSGEQIGHYAKILKEKPYAYAGHYWPHDGRNHDWSSGEGSRRDIGENLGIRPIDIIDRGDPNDGIEAVKVWFSQCRFDEIKCQKGLDAITEYHYEFDDDRKEFKQKPFHNWASNGADALRTGGKSDIKTIAVDRPPLQMRTHFDPRKIPGPLTSNVSFDPRRRAM